MSSISINAAGASPPGRIDPGVSSYLDLTRVIAAGAVVLSHLLPNLFGIDVIPGHDAVIVFFVISGYVIAYAAAERDRSLEHFAVNRLARLWSVLLPSLLVSAAAAVFVGARSTIHYAPPIASPGPFLEAALQNALFLGQNWFWAKPVPFSDPAWSLSYEAWYYAIYAAFIFAPVRWRWHAAVLGALLAGPAIVALMPCWLLGAWLYRRRWRPALSPVAAYTLFFTCLGLYALFFTVDLGGHGRLWLSELTANHSYRLRASTRFVTDFMNACLFAGTIVAVGAMPAMNRSLAAARGFSRAVSSKTFSLYLLHMPMFVLLNGGLGIGTGTAVGKVSCILLVVAVCVSLGFVTEAQLGWWRRVVQGAFDLLRGFSGAPSEARHPAGSSPR